MCIRMFVYLCYPDWRTRSGDVDLPNNLLNDVDFIDEELLKEILEDNQVRTHFPETWLFEQMKAGYLFIYNMYTNWFKIIVFI